MIHTTLVPADTPGEETRFARLRNGELTLSQAAVCTRNRSQKMYQFAINPDRRIMRGRSVEQSESAFLSPTSKRDLLPPMAPDRTERNDSGLERSGQTRNFLRLLISPFCQYQIISTLGLFLFCLAFTTPVQAAVLPPKPGPDLLVFSNGDRLSGSLERMAGSTIFFMTDGAGEVKVPLSKIRTLHVPEPFAILENGVKVRHGISDLLIPLGPLDLSKSIFTVHTAKGEVFVPTGQVAYLVDENTYKTDLRASRGIFDNWTGSVTAGASSVNATQSMTTFNTAIALTRTVPRAPWIPPSDRTILGFTSTYGQISQPNTPTIETNIFHGNAEQDKYFSQDFYELVQAVFDRNSTQGLALQQLYGGGFGYTVFKTPTQELDVTITLNYTNQQFQPPGVNQSLIGSMISDNYLYHFPNGVLLTEIASVTPQFNNPSAYSANASVGIVIPVFKKLGFSFQIIDNYLNDSVPGFLPNSLQVNAGLNYSLQ